MPKSEMFVLEALKTNPGIHFRDLLRLLDYPAMKLRIGLDRLITQSSVKEVKDGGFSRYFILGQYETETWPIFMAANRPTPSSVLLLILRNKTFTRKQLRSALKIGDASIAHAVNYLVNAGIVVKAPGPGVTTYLLVDEERVRFVFQELQRLRKLPTKAEPEAL